MRDQTASCGLQTQSERDCKALAHWPRRSPQGKQTGTPQHAACAATAWASKRRSTQGGSELWSRCSALNVQVEHTSVAAALQASPGGMPGRRQAPSDTPRPCHRCRPSSLCILLRIDGHTRRPPQATLPRCGSAAVDDGHDGSQRADGADEVA